jgi:hypothetical protein
MLGIKPRVLQIQEPQFLKKYLSEILKHLIEVNYRSVKLQKWRYVNCSLIAVLRKGTHTFKCCHLSSNS